MFGGFFSSDCSNNSNMDISSLEIELDDIRDEIIAVELSISIYEDRLEQKRSHFEALNSKSESLKSLIDNYS